jgi:hypothetical protein
MENILTVAFFTTLCFVFFKFIEYKFIDKSREMKPLKYFIRDSLFVFISSAIGSSIYFGMNNSINELVNVITDTKTINPTSLQVFTEMPGF